MRALAAAGLFVAGAAVGLAAVAVHELWWGLPLATVASAASLVALPAGWWTRLPYAAGWDAMVGWLTFPRPDGGYVVSADAQGYAVLGLGLLLLAGCVATLPRPASRDVHAPPS